MVILFESTESARARPVNVCVRKEMGTYPLDASETEASWCFGFLRGRKSISSRLEDKARMSGLAAAQEDGAEADAIRECLKNGQ